MKIKQQWYAFVVVAAAWALSIGGHAVGLLNGEDLMLVIAAVATLSMTMVVLVAASLLRAHNDSSARRLAEEVARQSAEQAAHSARMQQIGDEIQTTIRDNTQQVTDRVLAIERIYGWGIRHDVVSKLQAADWQADLLGAMDDSPQPDDLGTGPFPMTGRTR